MTNQPGGRPCRIWRGAKSGNGYGYRRGPDQRVRPVHVLAYEEAHGPVEPGIEIHHACEEPLCIELAHLEARTKAEHTRLHHSKIDGEIAAKIRSAVGSSREVAARFGISAPSVRAIRNGYRWAT
jgi:hypothetical protein